MTIEATPKKRRMIADLGLDALFVATAVGIDPNCRKCEEFALCLAAVSAAEIELQRSGYFHRFS